MITDDTFYDKHGDIRAITFTPAQFLKYSRELIALAQQIKPLEFVDATVGGWARSKGYRAICSIGTYDVYDVEGPNGRYCFYSFDYESSDNYQTLEEAIEAANQDYQRRVLSCLVWGGV